MSKVYVGVGHGGSDPGAVAQGYKESDLTLVIALACQAELTRHNVQTMISRTTDVFFPVAKKVPQCNAYNPDVALDIHINAGGGTGAEVWYYNGGDSSEKFARKVLDSIIASSTQKQLHGSGMKPDTTNRFGMVSAIKATSILVECAFIDSVDVQDIDTNAEQVQMGRAIAQGILNYLGVTVTPARTYVVKPGDGWWGIAVTTLGSGTKMHALADYNNLVTTSTLHPGQVLNIPTL